MKTQTETATLYYIHDPMCSWCYGFKPVLAKLMGLLPVGIAQRRLLGGLAADTDQPMPEEMQQYLQATWQRIQEKIPGIRFNFDFWTNCRPRRSTYSACRAVIAAREQGEQFDIAMTEAIQQAYYQQARNPSDSATLMAIANEMGLDVKAFAESIASVRVDAVLQHEIAEAASLGMEGMPSLVLLRGTSRWFIPIDYNDVNVMLDSIHALLEN